MSLRFNHLPDVPISDWADNQIPYSKCRECLHFAFREYDCDNCNFFIINKHTKKLYFKPVDRMKYVERLCMKNFPGEYNNSLREKYDYFLKIFLYKHDHSYRNLYVVHHYFLRKLLNKPVLKTRSQYDKVWEEFEEYYNRNYDNDCKPMKDSQSFITNYFTHVYKETTPTFALENFRFLEI